MAEFNVKVNKHVADDEKDKYTITLEGQAAINNLKSIGKAKITIQAADEYLLELFPRGSVFEVKLNLKQTGSA